MTTAITFKSGEFYGNVHHGARASIFDIRRMCATRCEDEVETHRHDDAHFVLVLSGVYISSALHAPPRAPAPTLVFNPAGTTHRDRFVDGKGSFMTVSLDPAILSGAEELRAVDEGATVLRDTASAAASFRIAREIDRGGDLALLEAGAWEMLASLHTSAPTSRRAVPAWAHQAYEAVMDLATDSHLRVADVAAALGVHPAPQGQCRQADTDRAVCGKWAGGTNSSTVSMVLVAPAAAPRRNGLDGKQRMFRGAAPPVCRKPCT